MSFGFWESINKLLWNLYIDSTVSYGSIDSYERSLTWTVFFHEVYEIDCVKVCEFVVLHLEQLAIPRLSGVKISQTYSWRVSEEVHIHNSIETCPTNRIFSWYNELFFLGDSSPKQHILRYELRLILLQLSSTSICWTQPYSLVCDKRKFGILKGIFEMDLYSN